MGIFKFRKGGKDSVFVHGVQAEPSDQNAADEKTETVDCVRNGDGSKSAENSVNGADEADKSYRDPKNGRVALNSG